jgi:hypothetical protein
MERNKGELAPLALLAYGDFGRWLNDPGQRFTYHQYLDFILCCDVATHTLHQKMTRGLPFVQLKLTDFSTAMTMLTTNPENVYVVYGRNVEHSSGGA